MMDTFRSVLAYLGSFFKSEWELDDYPLRFKEQNLEPLSDDERLEVPRWTVQIVNWWVMTGLGDTKAEALAQLRSSFESVRLEKRLPRPGTGLPVEFAESGKVERYEGVAIRFFPEILNLDWEDCFISDESSLWDFCESDSLTQYFEKIESAFSVDVSDIESGNLADIFERIHEAQST